MSFFLFYIIFITLLNVAVGFYAAMLLGYGPPDLQTVRLLLFGPPGNKEKHPIEEILAVFQGYGFHLRGMLFRTSGKGSGADEKQEIVPHLNVDEILKSVSDANVADLLEDEADEIEMVAPLQELFDDDLVSALMDKGTEAWLMGEKHVETSILKLNLVMMKSGKFSAELDQRLRLARGTADSRFVKNCMNELRDDCKNYLDVQATVTEQIRERTSEFGELAYLAEDIEFANMEQAAQIETTINNVNQLDPNKTEDSVQKLIKELSKLRGARHRLRDHQEKSFLAVARYEKRMDSIAHQLFIDEATGLRGRIGLEASLYEWWVQKRNENRSLCFALLDFVKFGEVNDEHGITVADNVIRYFGKKIEKEFTNYDLTGVFCGNCFMVVTANMGIRKTVSAIEKIRQTMERTTFTYQEGNGQFSLNLTCGVSEVPAGASDEDAIKTVEKTLQATKKAGRNHSFLLEFQGKLNPEPALVSSPSLGAEYATIDLDVNY